MRSRRVPTPVLIALALTAGFVLRARPAAAQPADTSAAGLGPTSAVPWNPPKAISPNEPWEAVLRFPGRVASLPLAVIGQSTRCALLAAEQGFYVQRFVHLFRGIRLPVSAGPASLGDRTGTGASFGIMTPTAPVALSAAFDASTRQYTRARVKLSAGPAAVEYHMDHRPSDRFFGLGLDSGKDQESRYGLLQDKLFASLQLASGLKGPSGPREIFSIWGGPRWSRTTRGYESDEPSTASKFPGFLDATLDRRIEHLVYGARIGVDHRGGQPHWSRGWRASFSAERFDRPLAGGQALAGAQFTRYQLLAEAGISFWRDPRSLRLTFRSTDNQICARPQRFLISDLARLGGSSGLAGYEPQRFHSLDAMNIRAAYVFPLAQHFEFDVHGDAGGVFADLQNEARPNLLKHSAGFSLRGRSRASVVANIGFDVSRETSRVTFSIGAEP